MKFYGKNEIVWDKENSNMLCRFVNGEYETKDSRTIKLLKAAGYRSDSDGQAEQGDTEGQEVEAEQEEASFEEMTYRQLKEIAIGEGLVVGRKSKAALIEALR